MELDNFKPMIAFYGGYDEMTLFCLRNTEKGQICVREEKVY
jgi:hypothetical protein